MQLIFFAESLIFSAVAQLFCKFWLNIRKLHFPLFSVRLSSDVEPVVTGGLTRHVELKTGYSIQNIRYIFQVITDAVAVRQVLQVCVLLFTNVFCCVAFNLN